MTQHDFIPLEHTYVTVGLVSKFCQQRYSCYEYS